MWSQTLQEVLPLSLCGWRQCWDYRGCRQGELCVSPSGFCIIAHPIQYPVNICLYLQLNCLFCKPISVFVSSGCTASNTASKVSERLCTFASLPVICFPLYETCFFSISGKQGMDSVNGLASSSTKPTTSRKAGSYKVWLPHTVLWNVFIPFPEKHLDI